MLFSQILLIFQQTLGRGKASEPFLRRNAASSYCTSRSVLEIVARFSHKLPIKCRLRVSFAEYEMNGVVIMIDKTPRCSRLWYKIMQYPVGENAFFFKPNAYRLKHLHKSVWIVYNGMIYFLCVSFFFWPYFVSHFLFLTHFLSLFILTSFLTSFLMLLMRIQARIQGFDFEPPKIPVFQVHVLNYQLDILWR